MAKIYEALYRTAGGEATVNLTNLTPKEYREKYRGNLFCTTFNCSAMITYVSRSGNRSHFRTWRGTEHSRNCDYYTEKIAERMEARTASVSFVYLNEDQMSRSMKEAYLQELMTEEEKALAKQKIKVPQKRIKSSKENEQISFELTTDPAYKEETVKEQKARLYKRNVDALTKRDVGRTRTIIGEFIEADFSTNRPVVRVKKNDIYANLLFEEAFFAETLTARERLSTISKYADEYEKPIIIAVGEIRENPMLEEFEVALFDYKAFRIDGQSLDSLAANKSIQQLSF